jgi:hypothetical protein
VAHAKGREVPTRIHLTAGSHELRVSLPDGRTRTETVRLRAGAPTALDLAAPKPVAEPGPPSTRTPEPAPESAGAGTSALPIVGGISLAAGAGFAVAAIVLGVKALAARDEFDASGQTDADLHDQASSLRTGANVCWVGTGVLATAGVVMLIAHAATSGSESSVPPSTQAFVTLTPVGAWLDVQF